MTIRKLEDYSNFGSNGLVHKWQNLCFNDFINVDYLFNAPILINAPWERLYSVYFDLRVLHKPKYFPL